MRYTLTMLVALLGTFQMFSKDDQPTIRDSIVTSEDLPAEFDSARTFHYSLGCANPESLLTELWKADIRVWRAWLPLDNQCMGPVGPRFTVELESDDSEILEFNFSSGQGSLHCATRLKRFIVSD